MAWGDGAPRGWPAHDLEIGTPVIGGTANCVLYVDAAGLAACDAPFAYNGADVFSIGKASFKNWGAIWAVLQLGGNACFISNVTEGAGNSLNITNNAYYDVGWKYISNDEATLFQSLSGAFVFYAAGIGAADAAIGWNNLFNISNNGNADLGGNFSIGKRLFESWSGTYSVLQIGGTGSILSAISEGANRTIDVSQNCYFNGTNWRYISADEASQYEQYAGTHNFRVAGLGPADAVITWQSALLLQNNLSAIFYGDTYWSGAGSGLLYGSAQSGTASIAWNQVAAQNTWYEISSAAIVDGLLNGITHDGSGQLTVLTEGVYDAIGIISVSSDTLNMHLQACFSVNGTEITTRAVQEHEFQSTTDPVVVTISEYLDLAANDTVEISIRVTDAGNPTITIFHYTLKLKQIGGT